MQDEKIMPSFPTKRVCLGESLPLETPFTVMADISDVCNFRCNYCFRGMGQKQNYYGKNKLMSEETFHQVVNQALEFEGRIKRFSLSHQGEPLAHPQFAEFVAFAKERDVADSVEIHTNGSLLNKELCEKIADSNLDRIIISLQGLNAKKYQEVCGVKIDYEKFYKNLQYLYHIKRDTMICIKIVDAALEEGEEQIFYEKYAPVADRVFVETVIPLWGVKEESEVGSRAKKNNKFGRGHKWQRTCPLMFYTINVLADGTIFPCTNITPPFVLGNINQVSLKECWEATKRRQFLKAQLEQTRDNHPICRNCYIPQNTIMTEEDMTDGFEEKILERMEKWDL